jgi:hypothetical protein
MTFKRHAMGPLESRPVATQFEANFHQLLRPALVQCTQKGNKKREGYIMGAFREALANYRVKTPEQAARSVEFTPEQAQKLLTIISALQKTYQDAAIAAGGPGMEQLNAHYQKEMTELSAIKVKLMVCVLMEVGNEQAE